MMQGYENRAMTSPRAAAKTLGDLLAKAGFDLARLSPADRQRAETLARQAGVVLAPPRIERG